MEQNKENEMKIFCYINGKETVMIDCGAKTVNDPNKPGNEICKLENNTDLLQAYHLNCKKIMIVY